MTEMEPLGMGLPAAAEQLAQKRFFARLRLPQHDEGGSGLLSQPLVYEVELGLEGDCGCAGVFLNKEFGLAEWSYPYWQ